MDEFCFIAAVRQTNIKQEDEYFKACSEMLMSPRHFCNIVEMFYRRVLSQRFAQL